MMAEKLVSIIIINYNTLDLVRNAVRSVYEHCDRRLFEIIVVDNCSPVANIDELSLDFPEVILIKSPENGGFAKGNNIGIRNAGGKYLLLLNSDTLFTADSISPCIAFLEQHPEAGSLSVPLYYPDGRFQKNARSFRSLKKEILDLFRPFLYILPYHSRAKLMLNQYFKGDFAVKVDWLSGAFLMIPKAVLVQLPGSKLDDRYFMYGEDQLWGWQIQQLGYENWFIPDAPVIHIEQASTDPAKRRNIYETMIARELEIISLRFGKGLYYRLFGLLYKAKKGLVDLLKRNG